MKTENNWVTEPISTERTVQDALSLLTDQNFVLTIPIGMQLETDDPPEGGADDQNER